MDLSLAGGRLYVAAGTGVTGDEIQVFDLDADGIPAYADYIPMPTWPGNGQKDSSTCLLVRGSYAYVGGLYSGLLTIELSNKSLVSSVAKVDAEGDWPVSLSVDGDYLYLADGAAGVRVYDIGGHPEAPALRQRIDTPGSACDLFVQGPFAYVADGTGGLQMIDVKPTQDGTPATEPNRPIPWLASGPAPSCPGWRPPCPPASTPWRSPAPGPTWPRATGAWRW
jgi:hypothetical protein